MTASAAFERYSPAMVSPLLRVFDVDTYLRAEALDAFIGATDHHCWVANHSYLFFDPISDCWVYIPFDHDFALRDCHSADWPDIPAFCDPAEAPFLAPGGGQAPWYQGGVDRDGDGEPDMRPVVSEIVFAVSAYRDRFMLYVGELAHHHASWERLGPRGSALMDRITGHVAAPDAVDSGSDRYDRDALDGCDHRYESWINPASRFSATRGGAFAPGTMATLHTTDTMRNFLARRTATAERETAAYLAR